MDSNRSTLKQNISPLSLPRWFKTVLFLVPGIFISLFFIWPVLNLSTKVLNWNSAISLLDDASILKIFRFTLLQASLSTLATLIVAMGPTYFLSRWDFKGKRLLSALIIVPFMLPTVVIASAFLTLLPESIHNTIWAIVIVHAFFNIAVIVKVVGSSWEHLPVDIEHASKTLGASRLRTFRSITLPLILPSIISACSIVFLFCFTSFGVIQIIGGPRNTTLETEIARRALFLGDVKSAAALSFSQLIFLGMVLSFARRYSDKNTWHFDSGFESFNIARTRSHKFIVNFSKLAIVAFVFTPIAAIFWSSVHIGKTFSLYAWLHLGQSQLRPGVNLGINPIDSIYTSLKYLVFAVLISVSIGIFASLFIYKSNRLGKYLDGSYMAPLGTSAVTIGLGMLITFDTYPFNWRASSWLIPVGHSLIAIPFIIRTLLPVLRSGKASLASAAATLGASPIRTLISIDLARSKRAIASSAAIAAAISLGEFGATTLLSRSEHDSMPIAIAKLIAKTGDIPRAQAYVLSSILALLTLLIVMAIEVKNA